MREALMRLVRWIQRHHHRAHARDFDFLIGYYERMHARLPDEIRRLRELRRYHVGRADSLSSGASRVNFRLGRSTRRA